MVKEAITIQIGQCGNQLGAAFFDALAQAEDRDAQNAPAVAVPAFFRESSTGESIARAVLLDTEPRAISAVVRNFSGNVGDSPTRNKQWRYRSPKAEEVSVWKSSGSSGAANNWAFGYYAQGDRMLGPAMELIQREAERCDQIRQLMILQSLAGGTGSGAGARITEAVRDEFGSAFIINGVVWPSKSGDVVVQSYNAALSLAHLNAASDGLICLHNDEAHDLCTRLLRIRRPTFADINMVLSDHLAGLFLPAHHMADFDTSTFKAAGQAPSRSGIRSSTSVVAGAGFKPNHHSYDGSAQVDGPAAYTRERGAHRGDVRTDGGGIAAAYSGGGGGGDTALRSVTIDEIVRGLCASPLHRLITLRAIPHVPAASLAHTAGRWEALAKQLRQMLVAGAHSDEGLDWSLIPGAAGAVRCVAAMLFARGDGWADVATPPAPHGLGAAAAAAAAATPPPAAMLVAPELYPRWAARAARSASGGGTRGGGGGVGGCSVWGSPHRLRGQDRTLVLASNCQAPVGPLDAILARAGQLRAVGAYLHQYERHGLGPEELTDCLASLEQLLADYRNL